jgi:inositol phosphorylceramide synthase catalytic subunit
MRFAAAMPLRHLQRLWGKWWALPAIPLAYALFVLALGDLRPEHVAFAIITCALGWSTERTKRFLVDLSPCIAVAIGYDLVRYARAALLSEERVIACGLRKLELSLFGVAPGVTAQDWLVAHHTPPLDLLFAVPYAVFVYIAFVYAAYLYFTDRPRMRRYVWAFAVANYLSFLLWLALPAAPPWYVRGHGCAIDLSVLPSPSTTFIAFTRARRPCSAHCPPCIAPIRC